MANEKTSETELRTRSRVSVQFKRTFNTGNYSSLSIDIGAWDDCKEKETIKGGIERLAAEVQGQFEVLCGKIEGKQTGGKK